MPEVMTERQSDNNTADIADRATGHLGTISDPEAHELIVRLAQEAHREHWKMTGDEGTADKLAALVTAAWQQKVTAVVGRDRLKPEFSIGDGLRERIDLVDAVAGIAYELKVSPNNVHMEFYRDIFKVIVARDNRLKELRSFVFLTPSVAAARLQKGLGRAITAHGPNIGLRITVVGI